MFSPINLNLNFKIISFNFTEDFGGHGNSYHGTGGRGNKRAQMRYCLRLIRSIVSTGQETVLQDLADQGAINQISSMELISIIVKICYH